MIRKEEGTPIRSASRLLTRQVTASLLLPYNHEAVAPRSGRAEAAVGRNATNTGVDGPLVNAVTKMIVKTKVR